MDEDDDEMAGPDLFFQEQLNRNNEDEDDDEPLPERSGGFSDFIVDDLDEKRLAGEFGFDSIQD